MTAESWGKESRTRAVCKLVCAEYASLHENTRQLTARASLASKPVNTPSESGILSVVC
jgi:hypothetical protein